MYLYEHEHGQRLDRQTDHNYAKVCNYVYIDVEIMSFGKIFELI